MKQQQLNTGKLIKQLLEKMEEASGGCDSCNYTGSSGKKPAEYNHWRRPTEQEAHQEWEWEYTSKVRPHWGDLWPTPQHLADDVKNAEITELTPELHNKLGYATKLGTTSSLKSMTSGYRFPRDVDRIMKGFHEHDTIPTPIVLKHSLNGEPRYRIMSGNTRANSAYIHGVKPKVAVIDITDHLKRTGSRGF